MDGDTRTRTFCSREAATVAPGLAYHGPPFCKAAAPISTRRGGFFLPVGMLAGRVAALALSVLCLPLGGGGSAGRCRDERRRLYVFRQRSGMLGAPLRRDFTTIKPAAPVRREVDQRFQKCSDVAAGDDDLIGVAAERAFLAQDHVAVVGDFDADRSLRGAPASSNRASRRRWRGHRPARWSPPLIPR
jgi:hypothetical protein